MQVVRHDLRLDLEHFLDMSNCLFEESITLDVFQVADVLAQKGMSSLADTNRVLQFTAYRKNRGTSSLKNTGTGTYPRERRSWRTFPEQTRATESSQRSRMSRLCTRNRSARLFKRESASWLPIAIGSSLMLPLVMIRASNPPSEKRR